ncbi:shTK domain protein [Cooperia oncophora]
MYLQDCQDLLHPRTGRSDCPHLKAYCNVPAYYNLMTQQCPKTCGRCKEAATASPGCQDLVNPKTGRSDCYKLIYYCNYPGYVELMKQQCPKTCRYCN